MAVPAYVDSTGVDLATRASTTLIAPSGITDGDLLIIFFIITTGIAPLFPATFANELGASNANFDIWFGVKIAASESGNYILTNSSAATQGWIGCYSNATLFGTNDLGSDTGTTGIGTGVTTTLSSITTTANNDLILFVSQDQNTTSNNLIGPSGVTPTFTKRFGESSINPSAMYVADGVLPLAGSTGIKSITNNNGISDPWSGLFYAFLANPATPPTPPVGGSGVLAANSRGIIGTGSAGNEYGNNNNNALHDLISSAPWPVSPRPGMVHPGVVNPGSTAVLGAIPQAGQRPSRAYN
jgi:hypothetical protein